MTAAGRPVFSAFHSDSGGHTESSEFVWGGRYAHLKGVPDPFSPAAPWTVRLDVPALEDLLRGAGRITSPLSGVEIAGLSPSGRVLAVRITTAAGSVELKGTDFRTLLGGVRMRSTLFTVRAIPGNPVVFEFADRGNGHGVGMSQCGPRAQALAGQTSLDILSFYYTGVVIEQR